MLRSSEFKSPSLRIWPALESLRKCIGALIFNRVSRGVLGGAFFILLALNFARGQSYTISGKVVNTLGEPLSGVTINLSGDVTFSCKTGADGTYSFPYLYTGSYTVTPWHSSYNFDPPSASFEPLSSDTVQNFVANRVYYIRGYVKDATGVGIKGVTVTLSGDSTMSHTTEANGYYRFSRLMLGNYEVTPFKGGWDFDPSKITYSPLAKDMVDQDFVGTRYFCTIQGHVTRKDAPDVGIASVVVVLTGPITETGAATRKYVTTEDGYYQFFPLLSGDYELRPLKNGWNFEPLTITFSPLVERITVQDFSGQPISPVSKVRIIGGENGYVNPTKNETAKIFLNPTGSGTVVIKIYTLRGDLVWEKTETVSEGENRIVEWNCKNKDGEEVVTGIYLVYIKGEGIEAKKKVAVLK